MGNEKLSAGNAGTWPRQARVYRADHVGSLLRPQELLEAHARKLTQEQLTQIEDKHILGVLQRQQDLGFGIVTDGELRRRDFASDSYDSVSGFDRNDAVERPL